MAVTSSALAFGELTDVVAFLIEIDKLKNIQRRTKVLNTQRQENTVEHSWHFAVAVMTLAPYADHGVDMTRVKQMALIHDIAKRYYFDNSQICSFATYQGTGCNHF